MVVEPIGLDAQGYFLEKIRDILDTLDNALASIGTDKILVTPDNPPNLDVSLSTRASESTLSAVNSKLGDIKGALDSVGTDKIRVSDGGGSITIDNSNIDSYLPNLDVNLSTRASESTLSALSGKFPSASALGDSLGNPTTTIIGSALLGWDSAGGVWERLKTDGSGRLLLWLG